MKRKGGSTLKKKGEVRKKFTHSSAALNQGTKPAWLNDLGGLDGKSGEKTTVLL